MTIDFDKIAEGEIEIEGNMIEEAVMDDASDVRSEIDFLNEDDDLSEISMLGGKSLIDEGVTNFNFDTRNVAPETEFDGLETNSEKIANILVNQREHDILEEVNEIYPVFSEWKRFPSRFSRFGKITTESLETSVRSLAGVAWNLTSEAGIRLGKSAQNLLKKTPFAVDDEHYDKVNNFAREMQDEIFSLIAHGNVFAFEPDEYREKDSLEMEPGPHLQATTRLPRTDMDGYMLEVAEIPEEKMGLAERYVDAGRYGDFLSLLDDDALKRVSQHIDLLLPNEIKELEGYEKYRDMIDMGLRRDYERMLNAVYEFDNRSEWWTQSWANLFTSYMAIAGTSSMLPKFLKLNSSDPRFIKFAKNTGRIVPTSFILGNARAVAEVQDNEDMFGSVEDILAEGLKNTGQTWSFGTALLAGYGLVGAGLAKTGKTLFPESQWGEVRRIASELKTYLTDFDVREKLNIDDNFVMNKYINLMDKINELDVSKKAKINLFNEGKELFGNEKTFKYFVKSRFDETWENLNPMDYFGVEVTLTELKNRMKEKSVKGYIEHWNNVAEKGTYQALKEKPVSFMDLVEESNNINAVEKSLREPFEAAQTILNSFNDKNAALVQNVVDEGIFVSGMTHFVEKLQNVVRMSDSRAMALDKRLGTNLFEAREHANWYMQEQQRLFNQGVGEHTSAQYIRDTFRGLKTSEMNKVTEISLNIQDKAARFIQEGKYVSDEMIDEWIKKASITGVENPEHIRDVIFKTRKIWNELHEYFLGSDGPKIAGYVPSLSKKDANSVLKLWQEVTKNPDKFFENKRKAMTTNPIMNMKELINIYKHAGLYGNIGSQGRKLLESEVNYLKHIGEVAGYVSEKGDNIFPDYKFFKEDIIERYGSIDSIFSHGKLATKWIVDKLSKVAPEKAHRIEEVFAGMGIDDLIVQLNYLQFIGGRGVFGLRNLGQSILTSARFGSDGFWAGHKLSTKDFNKGVDAITKVLEVTGELRGPAQLAVIKQGIKQEAYGYGKTRKMKEWAKRVYEHYKGSGMGDMGVPIRKGINKGLLGEEVARHDSIMSRMGLDLAEDMLKGGPLSEAIYSPVILTDMKNRGVAYAGASYKLNKFASKFAYGKMSEEEFMRETGLFTSPDVIKDKVISRIKNGRLGMFVDGEGSRYSLIEVINKGMDVNDLKVDKFSAEFTFGRDVSYGTQWNYDSANMGILGMKHGGPLNKEGGYLGSAVRTLYQPFHSWPFYALNNFAELVKHPETHEGLVRAILGLEVYSAAANHLVEANTEEWYSLHGLGSTMLEPSTIFNFSKSAFMATMYYWQKIMHEGMLGKEESIYQLTEKEMKEAIYQVSHGLIGKDRFVLRSLGGALQMTGLPAYLHPDEEYTADDFVNGLQRVVGLELNEENLNAFVGKLTNKLIEYRRQHEEAEKKRMMGDRYRTPVRRRWDR